MQILYCFIRLKNSNILIQLDLIEESDFIYLKKDSILVGSLNSSQNKNKIEALISEYKDLLKYEKT